MFFSLLIKSEFVFLILVNGRKTDATIHFHFFRNYFPLDIFRKLIVKLLRISPLNSSHSDQFHLSIH